MTDLWLRELARLLVAAQAAINAKIALAEKSKTVGSEVSRDGPAPTHVEVGADEPTAPLRRAPRLPGSGRIKPVVAERMPLAEAARAHELLEYGGHVGKVFLGTGTTDR